MPPSPSIASGAEDFLLMLAVHDDVKAMGDTLSTYERSVAEPAAVAVGA
jgi:hypothetical protein